MCRRILLASNMLTTDRPAPARLDCPLCGENSEQIFEASGHPIRDCLSCKHRFAGFSPSSTHVEDTYDDDYFFQGGAGYPNYLKNERLLRNHGIRLAKKVERFCSPGTVLDIGCAAGFILQGFQDVGWSGKGIEPNRKMAEFARDYCQTDVHIGSLDNDASQEQFDLVTLIQVIAHFEDPIKTVAAAINRIRPGGYCLVETWNLDSWSARLLGPSWHEYSPPSVLHWFRFDRLVNLFEANGCQHCGSGHLIKWITGHHGKSLLQSKRLESKRGKLAAKVAQMVPDDVALPYLSDDLGWLLFRRS